ncbi:MAG: hypothetical protein HQK53_04770 [Oligoflexia bacterium]|nr:hypothetical protein [Oligoflexia bacterium]
MEKKDLEQLDSLISQVVKGCGLTLYHLEYKQSRPPLLRVFILNEKTNTATIEECEIVDHALTPFIDNLEWITQQLVLEISSPGIYRELLRPSHFQLALNNFIKLKLNVTLEDKYPELPNKFKKNRHLRGKLLAVDDERVTLDLGISNNKNAGDGTSSIENSIITIAFKEIIKANVDPDVKWQY